MCSKILQGVYQRLPDFFGIRYQFFFVMGDSRYVQVILAGGARTRLATGLDGEFHSSFNDLSDTFKFFLKSIRGGVWARFLTSLEVLVSINTT